MALLAQICRGVEWSLAQARVSSGKPWERVTSVADEGQESGFEDGRFRFSFTQNPRTPADGTSGIFVFPFDVLLYRAAPGHSMDDEPILLDDLGAAAAAVENGSYPPGTDAVFVDDVALRRLPGQAWLTGVLHIRAVYDAALLAEGEPAQEWTPGP